MFSPITAADNIRDEFIGYISTLFHISDKDYAAQFAAALREEGAIAKGPYLDVSDSYKTGKSRFLPASFPIRRFYAKTKNGKKGGMPRAK